MNRTALRRASIGAATLAVLAPAIVLPATAVHATTGPGGLPLQSVTLLLKSADPAGLTSLANAHGISSRVRRERLAATEPTSATRSFVVRQLAARGLQVDSATPWSITASGDAAAVGTVQSGALASAVSAVVGGDDTAPVVHPLATACAGCLVGADFRSVYSTSGAGAQSGRSPLTIATLQFSGWDSSALTTYATNHGLGDPVHSGGYTAVSVDRASATEPDGGGGDVEVALDQESLLSTAPDVDQRAYFADNSIQGFVNGIERVATDAAAHHIAALSISWGDCEQHWGSSNISAVHTAIKQAVAAGVTVFASSGDSGSKGCQTSTGVFGNFNAVVFPASDPYVIGVGGTTVTSTSPVTETAWNDSGGGSSEVFARPGYQRNALPGATTRHVPDIASDADPMSGFVVTTSAPSAHLVQKQVGGTSLASPVSAALFTDTLEARGHEFGIGNVLSRLYDAPASAFRDITTGNNGHAAHAGYDDASGRGAALWSVLGPNLDTAPALAEPAYVKSRTIPLHVKVPAGVTYTAWRAGVGSRPATCTGLADGAVLPSSVTVSKDGSSQVWVQGLTNAAECYSATAGVKVDRTRPKAKASVALSSPTSTGHIKVRWTAKDNAGGSGIGSTTATVYRLGTRKPVAIVHATKSGSHTIAARQGATYRVSVVVADRAGNTSAKATAKTSVPLNDTKLSHGSGWSRHSSAHAYGHNYLASDTPGASAHLRAYGSGYSVLMTTCSSCGKAIVYLGGAEIRVINLRSSTTHYRVRFTVGTRSLAHHTVRIVAFGNGPVRIDAVLVTR